MGTVRSGGWAWSGGAGGDRAEDPWGCRHWGWGYLVGLVERDRHSFGLFLASLLLAGGQSEPLVTAQSLPPQIFSRIFR